MHNHSKYMIFFHFHFKKGMEMDGWKFLESDFMKKSKDYGCKSFEFYQSESDSYYIMGEGSWDRDEDAYKFQAYWHGRENEFSRFFTQNPQIEFFKLVDISGKKLRKTA